MKFQAKQIEEHPNGSGKITDHISVKDKSFAVYINSDIYSPH